MSVSVDFPRSVFGRQRPRQVAGHEFVRHAVVHVVFGGGTPVLDCDHAVVDVQQLQFAAGDDEENGAVRTIGDDLGSVTSADRFDDDAARTRDPVVFAVLPAALLRIDRQRPSRSVRRRSRWPSSRG